MSKIRVVGETRRPKQDVEKAINDHLHAKLSLIERLISDLEKADLQLSAKYQLDSESFNTRFREKEFGEAADIDYVDRESTIELLRQLRQERDMLKDALE